MKKKKSPFYQEENKSEVLKGNFKQKLSELAKRAAGEGLNEAISTVAPKLESPSDIDFQSKEDEDAYIKKYDSTPMEKRVPLGFKLPAHQGESPLYQDRPNPKTLINAKGENQEEVMNKKIGAFNAAKTTLQGFQKKMENYKFTSQTQVDNYNKKDRANFDIANSLHKGAKKSSDSIANVNKEYNKKVGLYNTAQTERNLITSKTNRNNMFPK